METKKLLGAILLCSSSLALNAQGTNFEEITVEGYSNLKGYTTMSNGGRSESGFDVYTGKGIDNEQHISFFGYKDEQAQKISSTIASFTKYNTLIPLTYAASSHNFSDGIVNIDSTFTVNGYSNLNGYTTMSDGGRAVRSFDVYTGNGLDNEQHISFFGYKDEYATNFTSTLASFTKYNTLIPLNYVASSHNFRDGQVYVDSTFTVKGYSTFQNEVKIFPLKNAPYTISFSTYNNKSSITFAGKDGYLNSGIIQSSSLSFMGGNVGIGTDNPEWPLDVKGGIHSEKIAIGVNQAKEGVSLHVSGKILCEGDIEVASLNSSEINTESIQTKDITVEMKNVADYVFEENYDLKDLSEVEGYIKENKHLPGIPSASEIEENGVSLSKMTNLLLEKIEELTLHMIQLEKENKDLKSEIQNLKK